MVQGKTEDGKLIISLSGRIDSANAAEYENKIQEVVQANPAQAIVVDCEKLDYATSAGLRVILRLKKAVDDTSLINVNQELYDYIIEHDIVWTEGTLDDLNSFSPYVAPCYW